MNPGAFAVVVVAGLLEVGRAQESAPPKAVPDPLAVARKLADTRFAGYVYGSSGKDRVDCVGFVVAVVEALAAADGKTIDEATRKQLLIANLGPDELARLDALVDAAEPRLTGVQKALVDAKLGVAIDPAMAAPGDFVQYWYRQGGRWRGHAVLVESVDPATKRATLYGSHQSTLARERDLEASKRKGGIGPGPSFALTEPGRKVFVVRWSPAAATTPR